jgi:hypothetical protein
MKRIVKALCAREWPPALAGVGLGVVVTVAVGLFGHRLSGAGAYQQLAAAIGRARHPTALYWSLVPRGLTWDVSSVLGGLFGAFLAALASGTFRFRTMPEREWVEAFGPSVARRWALAFVGAVLTQVGAGIAGGCTASLAVSGGALLAPGAFLFMAGMFAGGIPTAALAAKLGAKR